VPFTKTADQPIGLAMLLFVQSAYSDSTAALGPGSKFEHYLSRLTLATHHA
jgi:hypothetical protein